MLKPGWDLQVLNGFVGFGQGVADRVCLGLLPSSEGSWNVALKALRLVLLHREHFTFLLKKENAKTCVWEYLNYQDGLSLHPWYEIVLFTICLFYSAFLVTINCDLFQARGRDATCA